MLTDCPLSYLTVKSAPTQRIWYCTLNCNTLKHYYQFGIHLMQNSRRLKEILIIIIIIIIIIKSIKI